MPAGAPVDIPARYAKTGDEEANVPNGGAKNGMHRWAESNAMKLPKPTRMA